MSFIIKKIISLSNRNIELKKSQKNEETPSEWDDAESEDASEDVEYLINKEIENITKKNREEELEKEKVKSAIADEIIQYTWDNKATIKKSLSHALAEASTEKKSIYDYTFRTLDRPRTGSKNYVLWYDELYRKLDRNLLKIYILQILCSIKQKIIEILKLKKLEFNWKIYPHEYTHPLYYNCYSIDIRMSFVVPKF